MRQKCGRHATPEQPLANLRIHFCSAIFPPLPPPKKQQFEGDDLDLSGLMKGLVGAAAAAAAARSFPGLAAATRARRLPACMCASPSEKHLYSASSLMSAAQASTCFVRNELPLIKNQQK